MCAPNTKLYRSRAAVSKVNEMHCAAGANTKPLHNISDFFQNVALLRREIFEEKSRYRTPKRNTKSITRLYMYDREYKYKLLTI